jgi:hypothetical protein
MPNIDSNLVGLRFTEEESFKVLPGSGVIWRALEPNSFGDFGAENVLLARNPINASRQRKKGVVVDRDAQVNFEMDLTQEQSRSLFEGFFFAEFREKASAAPSAVDATDDFFTVADGTDFVEGQLIFVSGCAETANNGLHFVDNIATNNLEVSSSLVAETPDADALVKVVGIQATASADLRIDASGTFPKLTTQGGVDFTDLGLIPGEWVFIGGDSAAFEFATEANNGLARIKTVDAAYLEFDKTAATMVTDTATGKTVRVFFGDVLKNESDPDLIVKKSYQFERELATAGYEYVEGCVANTLAITMETADKITMSLGFVAGDADIVANGSRKAGTFPTLASEEAFNTSSDFMRIRLATEAAPQTPLAAFLMDMTININNGITGNKALGSVGSFDTSAGDFQVDAETSAYFSSIDAVEAVRDNEDVSLDFSVAKNNAGWLFDIPLVALGNGRLNVEKDQPITLPLTISGAEHPTLNHTMLAMSFPYLPTAAE